MSRWTLPGADRFLTEAIEDLQLGGAVVVRLPGTLEADDVWAEAVRRLPYTPVDHVDIASEDPAALPADVVAGQLGLEGAGWSAARLAAAGELAGRVLCLTGAERSSERPEVWADWVGEFASASAAVEQVGHAPAVLMVIAGEAGAAAPTADPRVRSRWWWGALDRLDVAVHLKELDRDLDPVDREQIIEVAGGDLELAERLAGLRCRDAAQIGEVAAARAGELGLDGFSEALGRRGAVPGAYESYWCTGAVDVFDGRVHWHAGILAHAGDGRLERRLWTAQVRALLPTIDLVRMELIELVRRHGLLPEYLLTVDLEVGELSRLLDRVRDEHRLGELAQWLRRCRNLLAHLDLVPSSMRDRGAELTAKAGLGE